MLKAINVAPDTTNKNTINLTLTPLLKERGTKREKIWMWFITHEYIPPLSLWERGWGEGFNIEFPDYY